MCRAYLIIQRVSFDHITYIAQFIHGELVRNFGDDVGLIICDEIDDTQHEDGAIIFVIGEGLKPHRRRPGCFYVYLNFSIVVVMGNPLHLSKIGWSAIRRKHSMLCKKQNDFDVVLDYFAPQTARLKRRLDTPVFGFSVAINPDAIKTSTPFHDRPFDVCFVGGMTPRRQKVLAGLTERGLRLSPQSGVIYEDIAAQSRCCINIHAYRSNHLETPRIIGAMAAGTPIITEPSYRLNAIFSDNLVRVVRLCDLVSATQAFCNDIDALEDLAIRSREWYKMIYLPSCRASWAEICTRVYRIAGSKELLSFSSSTPQR